MTHTIDRGETIPPSGLLSASFHLVLTRLFRASLLTTLALVALLVAVLLWPGVEPNPNFEASPRAAGEATAQRARPLTLATVAAAVPSLAEPFVARWSGVWRVTKGGRHRLAVATEGVAQISLDGEVVLSRKAAARRESTQAALTLVPGPHALVVELQGPAESFRVEVTEPGGQPRPFTSGEVVARTPGSLTERWLRCGALAARLLPYLGVALLLLSVPLLAMGQESGSVTSSRLERLTPFLLALLVFLYGSALRVEALVERFWQPEPAWAERLLPTLAELHPPAVRWPVHSGPYIGDPLAYLRHARHMKHFYEARFREPFFVAAAKVGLVLSGGDDRGISIASAVFSALTVLALFALGTAAVSPLVGLLASTGFALDQMVIHWSVEGWRDDAFAFLVVLVALAALRLYDEGSPLHAVFLGAAGAGATLTRITSFSLVVPLLLCLALVPRARPRRERHRAVALATLVFLGLVTPFLLSCWRAYGDPFESINAVTPAYYGGGTVPKDASVFKMMRESFRPWQLIDTAFIGSTVYPFARKWHFEGFWAPLGPLLAVLALMGAPLLLLFPRGRLLWVAWACALFPFIFTWRVRGGDAWRLTLHSYPFYLIAAGTAVQGVLSLVLSRGARETARAWLRGASWRLAAGLALGGAALLSFGVYGLYYLVPREAVLAGREGLIAASPRDRLFFVKGFHPPAATTNMFVRCSRDPVAEVRLPLRPGFDHKLVMRLLPPGRDGRGQRVGMALNGVDLGSVEVGLDPAGFGRFEVMAPATAVRPSDNRLEFRTESLARGAPMEGPDPEWNVGFVLWYVTVTPLARGNSSPPIPGTS